MKRIAFILLTGLGFFSFACAPQNPRINYSPSSSVTPAESLAIAESYRTHPWTPTHRNIWHQKDDKGVLINTPELSFIDPITRRRGWWVPGQENRGIPYQWGGFDTPKSFDDKMARGYAAGDIYSPSKRQQLGNAVSEMSAGVDCSGFISRCWRLPRAYSTREIPSICIPLSSYDQLLPGDVLNKHNEHVMLFVRFVGPHRQILEVYETGSPKGWRVMKHRIERSYLKKTGYQAYRYRGMKSPSR